MITGTTFGIKLSKPNLVFLRASIKTMAININARTLPLTILSAWRKPSFENMVVVLTASACICTGVFSLSQFSARWLNPSILALPKLVKVAVKRVSDLSTFI